MEITEAYDLVITNLAIRRGYALGESKYREAARFADAIRRLESFAPQTGQPQTPEAEQDQNEGSQEDGQGHRDVSAVRTTKGD